MVLHSRDHVRKELSLRRAASLILETKTFGEEHQLERVDVLKQHPGVLVHPLPLDALLGFQQR
eukprot:6223092-Prymnesium_polylepis.1